MRQSNPLFGILAAATLTTVCAGANVLAEETVRAYQKDLVADSSSAMDDDGADPMVGGEGDGAIGGNAPNPEPDRPMGVVIDDAGITASVKTKLLADPMVGGLKIDVDTREGVVYLTGDNMNSQAEIDQAMTLAKGASGVKTVESKMTVRDVKN